MPVTYADKTILLVHDDPSELFRLKNILADFKCNLVFSNSGKEAAQKTKLTQIDVVISKINMPNGNGIQLFNHIKKNYSIPVILMINTNEEKEKSIAIEAGVENFVSDLIDKDEIESMLKECLKHETQGDELIQLHLEDFLGDDVFKMNVYLRTNNCSVKISSHTEILSKDLIVSHRENGVESFYVYKEELINYLCGENFSSDRIQSSRKESILAEVQNKISNILQYKEYNKSSFLRAEKQIFLMIGLLIENESVLSFFEDMIGDETHVFQLSLETAFISLLICQYLGGVSIKDNFYVTACSISEKIVALIGNYEAENDLRSKIIKVSSDFTHQLFQDEYLNKSIYDFLDLFCINNLEKFDLRVLESLFLVFKHSTPEAFVEYQLNQMLSNSES